jgi:dehydrogenase/reductase SDR family protein 7B
LNKNAQNLTEVQKCDEEGNSITIVNLINNLSQISPQIDAVICCAGLSMRDSVVNMTGYAEQYIMNVNYTSIVTLCRMLIKQRFLQDGNIMVVSSIQGLLSIPWRSSYAASKAALQAYFTTLRHEFALQSVPISITIVSPGHVNTNLSMNAMTGSGTAHNQVDENTAHGIDPDDVARLALQATIKKYPELWLFPPTHKLIVLIQHWFPKFSNFFIRKARKDMIPVAADLNSSANKPSAKKNLGDNKKTN